MKTWKKVLLGCLAVALVLVIALGVTVWCLWGNELATLASISKARVRNDAHKDGSVYTMQVKGGFYLDDFVAQGGVKSDSELIGSSSGQSCC